MKNQSSAKSIKYFDPSKVVIADSHLKKEKKEASDLFDLIKQGLDVTAQSIALIKERKCLDDSELEDDPEVRALVEERARLQKLIAQKNNDEFKSLA